YGGLGGGAPGPEICSSSQFPCSSAPLAVAGGLTFSSLSAGWGPTCALTANGTAYCWGDNSDGDLGVGTNTGSLQTCSIGACSYTPLAVAAGLAFTTLGAGNCAGGRTFTSLSPFSFHTCGLTTAGVAYCWGSNSNGELGDGTTTSSPVPVRVAGQPGAAAAASRHDAARLQGTESEPAAVSRMLPP